ncbi:MAG: GWxTD domain-containing protein [Flavobacteriales bacterium]|nr:GWxTD domain-containing protein [Flavobacteriales bacterium]MCB9447173.1 GWxTD domain-containing protein [Flavobacteriales bacterium]
MKKHLTFACAVLSLILISGCKLPTRISSQNLSYIYKTEDQSIHPIFTVFHVNDSLTRIHYKLNSAELLYSKKNHDQYIANVTMHATLVDAYEYETIRDSLTHRIEHLGNNAVQQLITGTFNVHAVSGKNYLLAIKTTDVNRGESALSYIEVNKEKQAGAQYYRVLESRKNLDILRRYTGNDEEITIQSGIPNTDSLFVRFYDRDFPLPAPPFSIVNPKAFSYRADSVFYLPLNTEHKLTTTLHKTGFYHFQADSSTQNGITLYSFGDNYPKVANSEGLIGPLRYLTTQQEYDHMMGEANPRMAAEDFWRGSGGSDERSRDLMHKYYSRVENANRYFTSYIEGWKTDRGLIYIIFGPPNVLYKTSSGENWIYGEEHNALSLQFTFTKVDNPFSENDFTLNRSPMYKNSWYRAVDTWRQGRIY